MRCREICRWISPYLDSEVGQTKTFEISEHLRTCVECAVRFERERRVDEVLTDWLRRTPALDWEAIEAKAMRPMNGVFSLWRIGVVGAAACVLLAVWLSSWSWRGAEPGPTVNQWIVQELREASPGMRPFPHRGEARMTLAAATQEVLGVQLAFAPGAGLDGHPIELVDVCEKDAGGDCRIVEVRINCCGRPVLLAAARREDFARLGGDPSSLISSQSICLARERGLEVAAWCDERVVVVVAADHSAEDLAAVLRAANTDPM
jgi:anti-sigma factor RsiW